MDKCKITLSDSETEELMKGWKTGRLHTFRSRCNMVLLSNQGYNRIEIGHIEGVTRQTVANWLNRYKKPVIPHLAKKCYFAAKNR